MIETELDLRWREIPQNAQEAFYTAEDGSKIRRIDFEALASMPPKGSILFLPGRGDHYEKYLETLSYWSELGWHVTSKDWRGQGMSGRMLSNPRIGHIDDFSTWISDLRHFWQQWSAERDGPKILVAHSMGGHLAMRALVEKAVDPDAAVMSAPMLGIRSNGLPLSWSHAFMKFMVRRGKGEKMAWKESEKPMSPMSLRRQILTHSKRRYDDEMHWWEKRPDVRLGPPSWHWLDRAVTSTRMMEEAGTLENMNVPVLLLATKVDQLVSTKRIMKDHKRLPNSEIEVFGIEAAHELLREADNVRDKCLARMNDFIDRHVVSK